MSSSAHILKAIAALALLCACTPSAPTVIADSSEITAHRAFGSPVIRGADQCVDEISRMPEVGYGAFADVTLNVDRAGRVRLVDVVGPPPPMGNLVGRNAAECLRQVGSMIAVWSYRPFERDGRPVEAQIVEQVLMLPAERWQASPPSFPPTSNLDSVVITLERMPGLFRCERDRSPSYVLQIRGSGDVTINERIVQWGADHVPRLVDAPTRRFTIGRDVVERLIEQFRAARFFSLESEYGAGITDQPVQRLTFEADNARASVLDYVGETVGMPLVVRELEVAVDEAAGLEPMRCGPDQTLNPERQ